ncbi:MAG: putative drug exporter of the superfamily, partial [Gaiellales bacterium]|nr:putative drug exporter of the superfamily [Gaiellales bacterium]
MSGHEVPSSQLDEQRRIAHSGGLAHWAGQCARHPWRVIGIWLGVVVLLIGLNVAFHGTLVNEFKVPGTDFQKATDLINAKFGAQKGAPLRVVIAAPPGEALTTPDRRAAISTMVEQADAAVRKLDQNTKNATAIADPLASDSNQVSNSGRVAYFDAQFDRTGFELPRGDIVSLEDQLQHTGEQAGLQVAFTGEAESPPPEDQLSIVLGLLAGFVILLVLFRA